MDLTVDWPELVRHPGERDHVVHVYRDTAFLVEAVAEFIASGLSLGQAGLLIVRREHRPPLVAALSARQCHPHRALRVLDAHEVLETILGDGMPQWSAFEAVCGGAVAELRLQYPGVRAYGEMVDVLWQEGRHAAALQLEEYWNDLARLRPFALLCAYGIDPLDSAAYGAGFERICKAHSHLIPVRDYAAFNHAVDEAARQVLPPPLAHMLVSLSATHRPRTDMPLGQAMLFWLKQNMPRTAEKVLQGVRARLA